MNNDGTQLDTTFAALASKHRRAIVYRLSLQPSSISQLADELQLSLPAIHKHIKVLEEAQLLQRKKSGRSNFLALDRTALLELRNWIEQYHPYWGTNDETLENYVASIEKAHKTLKTNTKK